MTTLSINAKQCKKHVGSAAVAQTMWIYDVIDLTLSVFTNMYLQISDNHNNNKILTGNKTVKYNGLVTLGCYICRICIIVPIKRVLLNY